MSSFDNIYPYPSSIAHVCHDSILKDVLIDRHVVETDALHKVVSAIAISILSLGHVNPIAHATVTKFTEHCN